MTLRSNVKVPRRSLWYVTHRLMVMHPHTKYHWPTGISKDKNVMARTRKYYLKNNYLTLRSRFHKGHYGTRHTALWSCTHIPNIIDLSGKTKKLWSGRSRRRRDIIKVNISGLPLILFISEIMRAKSDLYEKHNRTYFFFTMNERWNTDLF